MNPAYPGSVAARATGWRPVEEPGLEPLGRSGRLALLLLGALATAAVAAYGLGYVLALPRVTPGMLLSGSFDTVALPRWFGLMQTAAVLLYSASLLPVTVALTLQRYRSAPVALVIGGSATCLALVMEVFNNLPVLVQHLYPGELIAAPAALLPYVRQTSWIRFAAFDVMAFTLLFAAALLYAAVFRREQPLLIWAAVGSVVVFVAHLPLLWVAPGLGAGVMGLSICLGACVPLLLAILAIGPHALQAGAVAPAEREWLASGPGGS